MAFVVCATWKAKPGEDGTVLELLRQVNAESANEPGCLLFAVHRSREDPGVFFLYEQYVSAAAFEAHATSEHVRRLVLEDAVARLESRRRELFELVE